MFVCVAAKHFLSSTSPVYIDESGEGVTDLAYHVPLDKVAQNPFDVSFPVGDVTAAAFEVTAADLASMTLDSVEFKSGGAACVLFCCCVSFLVLSCKRFTQSPIIQQVHVLCVSTCRTGSH